MQKSLIIPMLLLSLLQRNILCDKLDILREKRFPPCNACQIYVDSFKKGIETTSKGRFEGGDAAWEEEKLGSYSRSEVRLTEIQEKLCSDVEEGKNQCYTLNGDYDSLVEEWWFNYQSSESDLFKYLCINALKVCCVDFHYGPDCLACSGFPDSICSNNGQCDGAGTRAGNGSCICKPGYKGKNCDQCSLKYYESYKDNSKILCSKCHISCAERCNKAGPSGCLKCATGWSMQKDKGCVDVNECLGEKSVCSPSEFCVNNEGSYKCLKCDRSCKKCTGDGPDMCTSCASGYVWIDNICIDSSTEDRKQHVFVMRYLTYFGLALATCIILQRNITIAAIIGTCVAVYIAVSEYVLNTPPTIGETILQRLPNKP